MHADGIGSRIVLANDPDAGVAPSLSCASLNLTGTRIYRSILCCREDFVRSPSLPSSRPQVLNKDVYVGREGWKIFTGDQLGTLLGSWALRQHQQSGKPTGTFILSVMRFYVPLTGGGFCAEKLAMCASTVSSKMLRAMAKLEGFTFRETLTGFKYLGNESLELTKEGFDATFAYEEAIGFMCGTAIRDKDGVSALVTFCELAAALERQGKSVSAYLDDLYIKFVPRSLWPSL